MMEIDIFHHFDHEVISVAYTEDETEKKSILKHPGCQKGEKELTK